MAMSAPGVPAPSSVAPTFALHHDGDPDLKDAAVVATLPSDLRVRLTDIDHKLISATPCLQ